MANKKREVETTVHAQDDAGEWSTLYLTPEEYACLKSAGIKTVRDRRSRRPFKGPDPYAFVDRIMELPRSKCEEVKKKAEEEAKYLQDRLERLRERKARILREIDDEVDICADRLKEMRIAVGVCDEILSDETPYETRIPISELSDDEVPFDEGPTEDYTYAENYEDSLRRDRDLDAAWKQISGGPLY